MAKMNYKFGINSTIVLSRDFENMLNRHETEAMAELSMLQNMFPQMKIIFRSKHSRANKTQLTYKKMRNHLVILPEGAALLAKFEEVRQASRAYTSEYNFVRDWFFTTCENYGNFPKFGDNNEIIGYDELEERRKKKNAVKGNYTLKNAVND